MAKQRVYVEESSWDLFVSSVTKFFALAGGVVLLVLVLTYVSNL